MQTDMNHYVTFYTKDILPLRNNMHRSEIGNDWLRYRASILPNDPLYDASPEAMLKAVAGTTNALSYPQIEYGSPPGNCQAGVVYNPRVDGPTITPYIATRGQSHDAD